MEKTPIKKIIAIGFALAIMSTVVGTLLVALPVVAAEMSGSLGMQRGWYGSVFLPGLLLGTTAGFNTQMQYKLVGTNTGDLPVKPSFMAVIIADGTKCSSLTGTPQQKWDSIGSKAVFTPVKCDLAGATGNGVCTIVYSDQLSKDQKKETLLKLTVPMKIEMQGKTAFIVATNFVDGNSQTILDMQCDDVSVMPPEGKLTLEFISLAVIGGAVALITKGMQWW